MFDVRCAACSVQCTVKFSEKFSVKFSVMFVVTFSVKCLVCSLRRWLTEVTQKIEGVEMGEGDNKYCKSRTNL